jgi:hypothetical protein
MKMLPAGGTEVTGREESKNVGEMKPRKLSEEEKRQKYKKRFGENLEKQKVASALLNTVEQRKTR